MISYSLYVNVPLCDPGCPGCGVAEDVPPDVLKDYGPSLEDEIYYLSQNAPEPLAIKTVYVGGEHPTCLPAGHLKRVLGSIQDSFRLREGAEISLEMTPGKGSLRDMEEYTEGGVNRVSLKVEAFFREELQLLGKAYSFWDANRAVMQIREAGIDNLNLDLTFGIPGQTMKSWESAIDLALSLNPEHISAYSFSPQPGTALGRWQDRGMLTSSSRDRVADMYQRVKKRLAEAGYDHYEISSWAKPGFQCRHNLGYWQMDPYLGIGAGSHGYGQGKRTANVSSPQTYVQLLSSREDWGVVFPETPASKTVSVPSRQVIMEDVIFMGLHLINKGVSRTAFRERFGQDLMDAWGEVIGPLLSEGLVEWSGDRVRLSERGLLLSRQVFRRITGRRE